MQEDRPNSFSCLKSLCPPPHESIKMACAIAGTQVTNKVKILSADYRLRLKDATSENHHSTSPPLQQECIYKNT